MHTRTKWPGLDRYRHTPRRPDSPLENFLRVGSRLPSRLSVNTNSLHPTSIPQESTLSIPTSFGYDALSGSPTLYPSPADLAIQAQSLGFSSASENEGGGPIYVQAQGLRGGRPPRRSWLVCLLLNIQGAGLAPARPCQIRRDRETTTCRSRKNPDDVLSVPWGRASRPPART